jgi:hypothetical protein
MFRKDLELNQDIAGRLDEVARILAEQGANRFRVQAYHQAAAVLRGLPRPLSDIFAEEGLSGLEKLPGIGESIARSTRDILLHGKLAMLDRLRGEHDPIALLTSVPGIGYALVWMLTAMKPFNRQDWLLENLPVFAVVPVLVATLRRFRFSNLSYGLITIFLTLHAFGAHYTCSEMPVGNSADVLRRQFEEG